MATTTNFGWETPDDTDLVKDGALAMRTLGNAIDASMADLKGGTTGQVLSKNSNTDMDFTWVTSDDANAIQNAIVDAKGDLITATAADTPARLAVGSNDTFLTADSAQATGLKWSGTWTDWMPTWTNLTVGNGTYGQRRYNKIGKIVFWKLDFTFGSTTSITASDIRFSLPISGNLNGGQYSGNGFVLDSGTEVYDVQVEYTASDAYLRLRQANLTNNWVNGTRVISATSPFTWTTNDKFTLNGWYEVA